MPMSDEEALRIGRELAELFELPTDEISDTVLATHGRIAMRLCEPLVLRSIREPNVMMEESGSVEVYAFERETEDARMAAREVWTAMVDKLLEQKGMKNAR